MALLGEALEELRRQSFTGRDAEVAQFREAVRGPGVTFVHGPGGVGKTMLLDVFARVAVEAGRRPVRVDARHLTLGADALPTPVDADRPALFIDTYELLEPVDDWVRDTYLPSLPGDCPVVIAGRQPPRPRWRADPAWRVLTRVIALGNLPADDARAYLSAQDVPVAMHERLLAISGGHPLTLSMLSDAVRRGVTPRTLADLPDVVGALIANLVDEAPSPRHRAALEVCAHVPATTEDLLRDMIGGDVGEVFAWLRGRPFVDECPYGLYPHDVVRAALDADLRWRDPARYSDMLRRKLTVFLDRVLATPHEQTRLDLLAHTVVLNASRSHIAALSELPPSLRAYADGLREGDRASILEMTAAWQGAAQADLVAHWLDRRPEAFRAFRGATGDLCGYTACLQVTEADLGADPGVDAMWQYVSKHGAPRPGEAVRIWRFFLDREHGQRPSPSLTLFVACQMLDIIQLGGDRGWSLVSAFEDPERWTPAMEFLDFWPATAADFTVGGSRYPVFAHDWRRAGITEWATAMHARQLGAPARPPGDGIEAPVLSECEFGDAVRAALRQLHAPDLLRQSPLLDSRMIRRNTRPGTPAVRTLRELVEAGVAALEPADRELLTRTFLRPDTTQERVAAALHLSFNTYRRHRDRAVTRLAAWLWAHEIGDPGC
ncbi:hypothetical protein Val02_22700 [Virgisporangium aliadipatigenens]|uniref:ATP-binding protein n=1 Tax=Virgisporangium aliadipatigenens TaxID=741659 RepID=A0A8J4DPD1_9ACTN|nr:hypothetical protein [Virgisporangium aliadipatigenens]GIJ45384.1 hypothetical protein Val02_22700 [Virgisporangium aliadipatigenens]